MFLRREAELSSRIEDTHASVQTMLLFGRVAGVEDETPSVREVNNNFRTLEFAIASAQHRPLTVGLIREMHAVLLDGVRGHDKTPGKFRTAQAHIGRSADIGEARFVPSPPHAIESSMDELARYLTSHDSLPGTVRAALVHYQFETIHPFADGNGRVGRVLLLLQLIKEQVLPAPLFNPSAQLERHRTRYHDHLLNVSQKGDWAGWIHFFASSLTNEAADAAQRIERLESLREDYYVRVRAPRASALLPKLIDELFVEPSLSVGEVAQKLDVQFTSAQKLLDRLMQAGILREVTGRPRNRVYLAQGIVDLFSIEPHS